MESEALMEILRIAGESLIITIYFFGIGAMLVDAIQIFFEK